MLIQHVTKQQINMQTIKLRKKILEHMHAVVWIIDFITNMGLGWK